MLRLTHAPLPSWADFLRVLPVKKVNEAGFINAWRLNNEKVFCLSRSTWSLKLIAKTWQEQHPDKELCLWLPDFFCNLALSPLRELKIKLVYYSLDESLNPDLSRFEALSQEASPNLLILVHYFGKEANSSKLNEFCQSHECLLIEDATHVLMPSHGIGKQGDFVLYSPYKHLALPNGALLLARDEGPAGIGNDFLNELITQHQELLKQTRKPQLFEFIWLVKRFMQKIGLVRKDKSNFTDLESVQGAALSKPRMSQLSMRLLESKAKGLTTISKQRTQKAVLIRDLLSMLIKDNEIEINPINHYPYLISIKGDKASVQSYYQSLQRLGLPVSSWPDLPPEVLENEESSARDRRLNQCYIIPQAETSIRKLNSIFRKALREKIKHWQVVELSESTWQALYNQAKSPSFLQSSQYGQATARANKLSTLWLLVQDESGKAVAICQLLIRSLPFFGKIARINRGPVMIHGGDELAMASILCIVREARRKKIRYVKAAFERPMSERIMHQFKAFKFFKSRLTPWGSACLDLSLPSDSLLKNLNGKWRNGLRKAEKLELLVKRETLNEQNLTSVISWYESFQIGKNFTGISKALLSEFSKRNSKHFNSKVFFAHHPESSAPLGMLLTITSGGVSTYLIGVSNAEGRKAQVNSLLLWQAIMAAKSEGMSLFDLGGLNEETPAGIAKFKKGLNGSPYQLVGEWHVIPSWTLI